MRDYCYKAKCIRNICFLSQDDLVPQRNAPRIRTSPIHVYKHTYFSLGYPHVMM